MDWFATQLLAWFESNGRKDLPWQQGITPYRVWVSEVMLQQTQVATVIDYYNRFMHRFPTVAALATASLDDVLHHWTGLGYYARARNLHKAARILTDDYGGDFPQDQAALEALPGIGRSTAGAILAIAFDKRATILDGNVKRVLSRFHDVEGYPGQTAINRTLWARADSHTPAYQTGRYTQAIMDLGATLCIRRTPQCGQCPVAAQCEALQRGVVEQRPTPKPKKDKPVRSSRLFVLTNTKRSTLLEQKPLDGIWGGLWTPPQRTDDTTTASFLEEFDIPTESVVREHVAPSFRHTFTHYHLDIEPVYIHLDSEPAVVADRADVRWVFPHRLGDNEPIGLTQPAVRLLESLKDVFPS